MKMICRAHQLVMDLFHFSYFRVTVKIMIKKLSLSLVLLTITIDVETKLLSWKLMSMLISTTSSTSQVPKVISLMLKKKFLITFYDLLYISIIIFIICHPTIHNQPHHHILNYIPVSNSIRNI